MPTVYFEGSDESLDSWEFVEFLYLFRAAYAHALKISGSQEDEILNNQEKYKDYFSEALSPDADDKFISELFDEDQGELELNLNTINKSSPLVIAFIGVVSALALAVIVSGGKIDVNVGGVGHIKCTLPPLGTGIKNLRLAFRSTPRKKKRKQF